MMLLSETQSNKAISAAVFFIVYVTSSETRIFRAVSFIKGATKL